MHNYKVGPSVVVPGGLIHLSLAGGASGGKTGNQTLLHATYMCLGYWSSKGGQRSVGEVLSLTILHYGGYLSLDGYSYPLYIDRSSDLFIYAVIPL